MLVVELIVMVWSAGMLVVAASIVKGMDGGLTDICGAPTVPVIVMVKLAVTAFPHASETVKLKLKAPLDTGVPVMERVESELL